MKINVNLIIAGIPVSLNIDEQDEAIVRKSARLITERVQKYKAEYAEPEPGYCLALSALMHTIKMMQLEEQSKKINQLNEVIDKYM